jgi:hypothetical protein
MAGIARRGRGDLNLRPTDVNTRTEGLHGAKSTACVPFIDERMAVELMLSSNAPEPLMREFHA